MSQPKTSARASCLALSSYIAADTYSHIPDLSINKPLNVSLEYCDDIVAPRNHLPTRIQKPPAQDDGPNYAKLAKNVRPSISNLGYSITTFHLTKVPSVILVLSLASFIPQIRLLVQRRNSSGISPYYVLFNLISATEQFAISFYFIVDRMEEPPDVFTNEPLQTGDWLNLAQVTLVWGLWLFM